MSFSFYIFVSLLPPVISLLNFRFVFSLSLSLLFSPLLFDVGMQNEIFLLLRRLSRLDKFALKFFLTQNIQNLICTSAIGS